MNPYESYYQNELCLPYVKDGPTGPTGTFQPLAINWNAVPAWNEETQEWYIQQANEPIALVTLVDPSVNHPTSITIGKYSSVGGAGYATVTIGYNAGGNPTSDAIADGAIQVGFNAGKSAGDRSIILGNNAGGSNSTPASSFDAIAIGTNAGYNQQQPDTIAIGHNAGYFTQGVGAVAIGAGAGSSTSILDSQQDYTVAIGYNALATSSTGMVVINASGVVLAPTGPGVFISDVQTEVSGNMMVYDPTTSELAYIAPPTFSSTPGTTNSQYMLNGNGYWSSGSYQPNRNLLFNGAMTVAQRGTGGTGPFVSANNTPLTADLWDINCSLTGGNQMTTIVENDINANNVPSSNALVLISNNQTGLAADSFVYLQQKMELQNISQIYTTSTGPDVFLSLSFYAKRVPVTSGTVVDPTFVALLLMQDVTAAQSYVIKSSVITIDSEEWKYYTYSFNMQSLLARPNGVKPTDAGLILQLWVSGGTNYQTGTSWPEGVWITPPSSNIFENGTNWIGGGGTNVATNIHITCLQLEQTFGPMTITPFATEPYSSTLQKCLRYFYQIGPSSAIPNSPAKIVIGPSFVAGTDTVRVTIPVMCPMRTTPTALVGGDDCNISPVGLITPIITIVPGPLTVNAASNLMYAFKAPIDANDGIIGFAGAFETNTADSYVRIDASL